MTSMWLEIALAQSPFRDQAQVLDLLDGVAHHLRADRVHRHRIAAADEDVELSAALVQQSPRRHVPVEDRRYPLDDAEVGLHHPVEAGETDVQRVVVVEVHAVFVDRERLLVLHAQRHCRHRVGLQLGQAQVEVARSPRRVDERLVEPAGDAYRGFLALQRVGRRVAPRPGRPPRRRGGGRCRHSRSPRRQGGWRRRGWRFPSGPAAGSRGRPASRAGHRPPLGLCAFAGEK